jgi:membrane protease YdiL (CAAX protease family)
MIRNRILLSGTWEKPGRNPLVAAFILVFVTGGIYFSAGSFTFTIYFYIDYFLGGAQNIFSKDMDYFEMLTTYYTRYKFTALFNTLLFQYLLFFLFPVLVIRKWHTPQIFRYFKYNRFHLKGTLLSVCGVFFIIPLVDAISRLFYVFFPVFERLSEISKPLLTAKNPAEYGFIVLAIAITPAICEEAVFRGYFQRTLERKLKFPLHFIISGTVFALFHQSTFTLLALILVGAYLGFLYYCYSSIYVTMAVHFIYNFTLIVLTNLKELPDILVTGKGYFRLPVVGTCLALFAGLVFLIYRSKVKQIDEELVYPEEVSPSVEMPLPEQATTSDDLSSPPGNTNSDQGSK